MHGRKIKPKLYRRVSMPLMRSTVEPPIKDTPIKDKIEITFEQGQGSMYQMETFL